MSISYLYSARIPADASNIYLLVAPEWMEVSLKAQGLTLDRAWDANNETGFSSIFSDQDLIFHDEVSCEVNELLFGSHKYSADKSAYNEQMAKVVESWFALPFGLDTQLNLHPVVLASNVIALVNYKGEDAEKVCETNIYERLLQCIHRLVVSQVGTRAWNSPLVRAVLERIRVGQLAA